MKNLRIKRKDCLKNIVVVKGLKKYFKTENLFYGKNETVKAVDGVAFALETGKILAIAGESGSGKTTIARCVAGLETPDEGTMDFDGKTADFGDITTRRKIQYIFQDTYSSLNPRMRVSEILGEPARFHFRLKGNGLENEIMNRLEDVGLAPAAARKYPHELSGGQRQRVVIARALTMRPELLIADEPVSSLDVSVQAQILRLFSQMNKKGISIIFITHDLRIVKNLADSMIVLRHGRIAEEGPVGQIYRAPASDYTKLLLASIPNSPYKYSRI